VQTKEIQEGNANNSGGDDGVLREGLLRPAVQGMTYPVSDLVPISAAIGNVVRAHVSCSCQPWEVINILPRTVP